MNIIPQPQDIIIMADYLQLDRNYLIEINSDDLSNLRTYLQQFLKHLNKKESTIKEEEIKSNENIIISLQLINQASQNYQSEGYQLIIDINSITIFSNQCNGIFYGIQTLKQIFLLNALNQKIPCVKITDYPRFQWRGMLLDVARHFMPKQFIIKFIDNLAFYKFNIFHWHLTDDQGWRIEIKKYPNLTQLYQIASGINGAAKNCQFCQQSILNNEHCGYYTQEDIKEIVTYAESNFITIVPEIDGPGHCSAAIYTYPELGCSSAQQQTRWQDTCDDVLNLKEETFLFMENVFKEVIELFPGKYVHIGGDDARTKQWSQLNYLNQFMQEKGLNKVEQIQGYYNTRIHNLLQQRGKVLIGWDETLYNQDKCKNKIIMTWRSEDDVKETINQQLQFVMCLQSCLYFDIQESLSKQYPLSRPYIKKYGVPTLMQVYNFDPASCLKEEKNLQYILGAQGQLWTEAMFQPKDVEYKAFPRIMALSEIIWTHLKNKPQFIQFKERVLAHCDILDKNDINYCTEFKNL